MVAVVLDVPTAAAPRQRTQVEVPQMSHFRFHERFRWPVDQVLLVNLGMVADPVPRRRPVADPGPAVAVDLGPTPGGPARS